MCVFQGEWEKKTGEGDTITADDICDEDKHAFISEDLEALPRYGFFIMLIQQLSVGMTMRLQ